MSATKGLETDSQLHVCRRSSTRKGRPGAPSSCSGPSFAAEVARGLPTAVLAASRDAHAAADVQERFRGPTFRLYVSDDVAGVEIGGAMKNVIAIAAGAVEGLGLGHNAMAALITRGLAEISRFAARRRTPRDARRPERSGDLVMTCTGDLSRNRTSASSSDGADRSARSCTACA